MATLAPNPRRPDLENRVHASATVPSGYSNEALVEVCTEPRASEVPGGADDIVAPEYSDDALARKFTAVHGDNLRYTQKWSRWHTWTGTAWKEDETLAVIDKAREVCRVESTLCPDKNHAKRIASSQTVYAVQKMASSDRKHAATVEQWDSHRWLLNTPAGTVDLKTGTTREARREDYLTKMTAVAPSGECTLFLEFLDRVTAGDVQYQQFLQRMAGYMLTGSTQEEAIFFAYGPGGNGKSKFIGAMAGVLGDYAKPASMDIFTETKHSGHPAEIAALKGARLVTAIETEQGKTWQEAKLKALTGGDRISTRFMHQNPWEFQPEFKPLIAGNHKPNLRSVDESWRRRFYLLPFTVTIPKDERDPNLAEKLKEEWPGILAWAIEGCRMWLAEGLNPPAAVIDATNEYLQEQDTFARWMDERAERRPDAWGSSRRLYADWKGWAEENNERPGTKTAFSLLLKKNGFQKADTNKERGFAGIALKDDAVTGMTAPPFSDVYARAHNVENGKTCPNPSLDNRVGELRAALPPAPSGGNTLEGEV